MAPAVAADAGAVALLTGIALVLCAAALVRLALTALPELVEAWR